MEAVWVIYRRTSSSRQPQQSDAVTDSHDAEDAVDRQSGPERRLGVLLEDDEDLLLRVLSCAMDDGLHECRRVCRRWRDACGELPVRLGGSYLDKLDRVADLFPKAVSLTIAIPFDRNDVVERQAIQHLTRLKNLQNLDVFAESYQADINSLVAMLPLTGCLRSLVIPVDQKDRMNDVLQVLRLVTNLESLVVHADTDFIQEDLSLDPVSELRELKHLSINIQMIANSRGELLFPSLTRLTHLEFLAYMHGNELQTSFSLKVCGFR